MHECVTGIFYISHFLVGFKFGRSEDSKIVGGWYVEDVHLIPFMVSIQVKQTGHHCGASLLTPFYVLTACHCLVKLPEEDDVNKTPSPYNPEQFLFVAGATDLEKDKLRAQIRQPHKFHIHPKCTQSLTVIYDFAVGETKTPFDITERVKPFKLLTVDATDVQRKVSNFLAQGDIVCQVAGWGETRKEQVDVAIASMKLKAVRMYTISPDKCKNMFIARNEVFSRIDFRAHGQFCVVSKHSNESDCLGDSGSPYFCRDTLIGVVSYGFECGTHMPSVYSELKPFLEWFMTDIYPHRPNYMTIDYLRYSTSSMERLPVAPSTEMYRRSGDYRMNASKIIHAILHLLLWDFLPIGTSEFQ